MTVRPNGYVPTGHPFSKVIGSYLNLCLDKGMSLGLDDFSHAMRHAQWGHPAVSEKTATAYLFPLRPNELDLAGRPLSNLRLLATCPNMWLESEFGGHGFVFNGERRHVCLIDAWLVGYHRLKGREQSFSDVMMLANFAGTNGAANTLKNVGSGVGKYFGLLNERNEPTSLFLTFFGESMRSLEDAWGIAWSESLISRGH